MSPSSFRMSSPQCPPALMFALTSGPVFALASAPAPVRAERVAIQSRTAGISPAPRGSNR
ncbi:MAG: hypothetical protein LBJ02_08935 [Bifidobacteriaceae bacterium]|jgi:hypothetical protein|nr:hypothetical protein [Bifidobacteriaceae bacterium]